MQVGARYYDAQVGRFITRDTYLSQKPYQYCEHDPVNAVDPSGHENERIVTAGNDVMAVGGGIAGIGAIIAIVPGGQVAGGVIVAVGGGIVLIGVIIYFTGRSSGPDTSGGSNGNGGWGGTPHTLPGGLRSTPM